MPEGTKETPNIIHHSSTSNADTVSNTESKHDLESSPRTNKRPDGTWPEGTLLFVGDSIIGGIDEKRLSGKQLVKVRSFGGSTIQDMVFYITPLLQKRPSVVVLHVCCNNSNKSRANEIIEGLTELKCYIEEQVEGVKVVFSTPTLRMDDRNAAKILDQVSGMLRDGPVPFIDNSNIDKSGLGQRKLHLNSKGTARLAMNYLNFLKSC